MNGTENVGATRVKPIMTRAKKRLLCYILVMALPVLQFCFFYIYVNLNSILMAFKKYDPINDTTIFAGFSNFKDAFQIMGENPGLFKYSAILYLVELLLVLFLAVIFSYYISKKYLLSGLFRVILYMPVIVSSICFVQLYRTLTTTVTLKLFEVNLLDTKPYWTILFFTIWTSFGTNVLLFTGSMSAIPASLTESAQLDGATILDEFIHIVIPSIWHTFVTFIVIGIAGIFSHQMNLYTFYGEAGCEFETFGYFFYKNTVMYATSWRTTSLREGEMTFQILSAMGLIITIILVPVTLGVRRLLEKFGPSAE